MNITKFYKDCNKRLIDALFDSKKPRIIVWETWLPQGGDSKCKMYTLDGYVAFVLSAVEWRIEFGSTDNVVHRDLDSLFKPFTDGRMCKIGIRGYGVSGKRVLLDDIYEIDVKLIKQFGPIDEIELWRDTTTKSAAYVVTYEGKVLGLVMGAKPANGSADNDNEC